MVVAGGILFASGHSLYDLLGFTYFAAKKKDSDGGLWKVEKYDK